MIKLNYGCGDIVQASCISTEAIPNTQSSLENTNCNSQEDFNEDVYGQLENIWTENDLEALGELCLSYVEIGGKKVVKNVLLRFEEKICELQERILELETTAVFDKSLVGSGLDLDCLTDACNSTINTYKELFQALITKSCTP